MRFMSAQEEEEEEEVFIPEEIISCAFTADNAIKAVYLNGNNVTSEVIGNLDFFPDAKFHTFINPTATSSPQGSTYSFLVEEFATASTEFTGIKIACKSSFPISPWNTKFQASNGCTGFKSKSKLLSTNVTVQNTIFDFLPRNWFLSSVTENAEQCTPSTSGFFCDRTQSAACADALKIWLPNPPAPEKYNFGGIRFVVQGSSIPEENVTCSFTADDAILEVYLNGVNVTSDIQGDLRNTSSVKTHVFINPNQTSSDIGSMYAFKLEDINRTSTDSTGIVLSCKSSFFQSPWKKSFTKSSSCSGFLSFSPSEAESVSLTSSVVGDFLPKNWFLPNVTEGSQSCTDGSPTLKCAPSSSCEKASSIWVPNPQSITENRFGAIRFLIQGASSFKENATPQSSPADDDDSFPVYVLAISLALVGCFMMLAAAMIQRKRSRESVVAKPLSFDSAAAATATTTTAETGPSSQSKHIFHMPIISNRMSLARFAPSHYYQTQRSFFKNSTGAATAISSGLGYSSFVDAEVPRSPQQEYDNQRIPPPPGFL